MNQCDHTDCFDVENGTATYDNCGVCRDVTDAARDTTCLPCTHQAYLVTFTDFDTGNVTTVALHAYPAIAQNVHEWYAYDIGTRTATGAGGLPLVDTQRWAFVKDRDGVHHKAILNSAADPASTGSATVLINPTPGWQAQGVVFEVRDDETVAPFQTPDPADAFNVNATGAGAYRARWNWAKTGDGAVLGPLPQRHDQCWRVRNIDCVGLGRGIELMSWEPSNGGEWVVAGHARAGQNIGGNPYDVNVCTACAWPCVVRPGTDGLHLAHTTTNILASVPDVSVPVDAIAPGSSSEVVTPLALAACGSSFVDVWPEGVIGDASLLLERLDAVDLRSADHGNTSIRAVSLAACSKELLTFYVPAVAPPPPPPPPPPECGSGDLINLPVSNSDFDCFAIIIDGVGCVVRTIGGYYFGGVCEGGGDPDCCTAPQPLSSPCESGFVVTPDPACPDALMCGGPGGLCAVDLEDHYCCTPMPSEERGGGDGPAVTARAPVQAAPRALLTQPSACTTTTECQMDYVCACNGQCAPIGEFNCEIGQLCCHDCMARYSVKVALSSTAVQPLGRLDLWANECGCEEGGSYEGWLTLVPRIVLTLEDTTCDPLYAVPAEGVELDGADTNLTLSLHLEHGHFTLDRPPTAWAPLWLPANEVTVDHDCDSTTAKRPARLPTSNFYPGARTDHCNGCNDTETVTRKRLERWVGNGATLDLQLAAYDDVALVHPCPMGKTSFCTRRADAGAPVLNGVQLCVGGIFTASALVQTCNTTRAYCLAADGTAAGLLAAAGLVVVEDGLCTCCPGDDPAAMLYPTALKRCDKRDDNDGDGVCDSVDNCPDTYNPDQSDVDDDGVGDVCDWCPTTYTPCNDRETDLCGVCRFAEDPDFNDCLDCFNVVHGTASFDACGICLAAGDPTRNTTCTPCADQSFVVKWPGGPAQGVLVHPLLIPNDTAVDFYNYDSYARPHAAATMWSVERADTTILAITRDPSGRFALVIIHDDVDDSGGATTFTLNSTWAGDNVRLRLRDDRTADDLPRVDAADASTYTRFTGAGIFTWSWGKGHTDGAVLGWLPRGHNECFRLTDFDCVGVDSTVVLTHNAWEPDMPLDAAEIPVDVAQIEVCSQCEWPCYVRTGIDLLRIPASNHSVILFDDEFVVNQTSPTPPAVPADFFFPGSDPFSGTVAVSGVGAPQIESHPPGRFGDANIVLHRTTGADMGAPGGSAGVPTEVVGLSLRSVEPVAITSSGGTPVLYHMYVTRDPLRPCESADLILVASECSCADGGTAEGRVRMWPLFRFVPVNGTASLVRTLRYSAAAPQFITVLTILVPTWHWTMTAPPAFGVTTVPPGTRIDKDGDPKTPSLALPGTSNFFPTLRTLHCDGCLGRSFVRKRVARLVIRPIIIQPQGSPVTIGGLLQTVLLQDDCVEGHPDYRDRDGDGVCDRADNCPDYANSWQEDSDDDAVGDACDSCPLVYNPCQEEEIDACDQCLTRDDPWFNETCAGCDGVPNSGLLDDTCGVCDGDGTTCIPCEEKLMRVSWTNRRGRDRESLFLPIEFAGTLPGVPDIEEYYNYDNTPVNVGRGCSAATGLEQDAAQIFVVVRTADDGKCWLVVLVSEIEEEPDEGDDRRGDCHALTTFGSTFAGDAVGYAVSDDAGPGCKTSKGSDLFTYSNTTGGGSMRWWWNTAMDGAVFGPFPAHNDECMTLSTTLTDGTDDAHLNGAWVKGRRLNRPNRIRSIADPGIGRPFTLCTACMPDLDCAGVVGGLAVVDDCGNCTGGTTGAEADGARDVCGVCHGAGDTCDDCAGRPTPPGTLPTSVEDDCGVCRPRGDPHTDTTCLPCTGKAIIAHFYDAGLGGNRYVRLNAAPLGGGRSVIDWYAYNTANAHSSATSAPDVEACGKQRIVFVREDDANGGTYAAIVNDCVRGTAGSAWTALGGTWGGHGTGLAVRDDSAPESLSPDPIAWDSGLGIGFAEWSWVSSHTDGLALGPCPPVDGVCLTVHTKAATGLSGRRPIELLSWNATTGAVSVAARVPVDTRITLCSACNATEDCAGVGGGDAYEGACGCVGGTTGLAPDHCHDRCGVPNGDDTECCRPGNPTWTEDACGVCLAPGDPTRDTDCLPCTAKVVVAHWTDPRTGQQHAATLEPAPIDGDRSVLDWYNWGDGGSGTGIYGPRTLAPTLEAPNKQRIAFVRDNTEHTHFVLTNSQGEPGSATGYPGSAKAWLGGTWGGMGAQLILSDDPPPIANPAEVAWSEASGSGSADWAWNEHRADGVILGPAPPMDGVCLTVKVEEASALGQYTLLMTWNETLGDFSVAGRVPLVPCVEVPREDECVHVPVEITLCCTCNATKDCAGVGGGSAFENACGCVGGTTGLEPGFCNDPCDVPNGRCDCCDCNGDPHGSARLDDCMECVEGNTGRVAGDTRDACHVCHGDNTTCDDCFGVPQGEGMVDRCDYCKNKWDPTFDMGCDDCLGVPDGSAVYDDCHVCRNPDDEDWNATCAQCPADGHVRHYKLKWINAQFAHIPPEVILPLHGQAASVEAFYSYDVPVDKSANTGLEQEDAHTLAVFRDAHGNEHVVMINDAPGDDDGGSLNMMARIPGLSHHGVHFRVLDDAPGNDDSLVSDRYARSEAQEALAAYWSWTHATTDGVAFGPLPPPAASMAHINASECITVRYTNVMNLWSLKALSQKHDDGEVIIKTLPLLKQTNQDEFLQICAFCKCPWYDVCDVCQGDGTLNPDGSSCLDCRGTPNGGAEVDDCGVCGGSSTHYENGTSCLDCAGQSTPPGQTWVHVVDACGKCRRFDDPNTNSSCCDPNNPEFTQDACWVCLDPEDAARNQSCVDCRDPPVPNGQWQVDACRNCNDPFGPDWNAACLGCDGIPVPLGGCLEDVCGVCCGDNSTCVKCSDPEDEVVFRAGWADCDDEWETIVSPFNWTTVEDFYSYANPTAFSANPPYPILESNKATIVLVVSDVGEYSLVYVNDIPADGSGGQVSLQIESIGLAGHFPPTEVRVRDDPTPADASDSYWWNPGSGIGHASWEWLADYTDGLALGPLPFESCVQIRWFETGGLIGLNLWSFHDGQLTKIPVPTLHPGKALRICSCCDCPWKDVCGVCGGDGTSCLDCASRPTPPGTQPVHILDACDVCVRAGSLWVNESCANCKSEPILGNTDPLLGVDACGVCFGGNLTCDGCDGVALSGTVYDDCGACRHPADHYFAIGACACTNDTLHAVLADDCGVCGGDGQSCRGCDGIISIPKAVVDACGVCDGDGSSCWDCRNISNGGWAVDECGDCKDPTDLSPTGFNKGACVGCDWVPNSGLVLDACAICGGDNSTCTDCKWLVNGPHLIDPCGKCRHPHSPYFGLGCQGCDGIPFSGKTVDRCGHCLHPWDKRFNKLCRACDGLLYPVERKCLIDEHCYGLHHTPHCHSKRHVCVAEPAECLRDAQCRQGHECLHRECVRRRKPCSDWDDCRDDQFCDEASGFCAARPSPPPPHCYAHHECPAYHVCTKDGHCVPKVIPCGHHVGNFTDDDACPPTHVCEHSLYKCVPKPQQCHDDGNCPATGSRCENIGRHYGHVNLRCAQRPRRCYFNSDCGGGEFCWQEDWTCRRRRDQCTEDADCREHERCETRDGGGIGRCDTRHANDMPLEDPCGECEFKTSRWWGATCRDCAGRAAKGNTDPTLGTDECGVCYGDDTSCAGCDGVPNSGLIVDPCGDCGGFGMSCADCSGTPVVNNTDPGLGLDDCFVCGGDNETCRDCLGVPGGNAFVDECGDCDGFNNGCEDCEGTPHGLAVIDECGVCATPGDGVHNVTCQGCDGVPNSGLIIDECGDCGGFGVDCAGCDGVPHSGLEIDGCGICGGDNSTCVDCRGIVDGPYRVDACSDCRLPADSQWNLACAGCDGVPFSGIGFDACGLCGGDNRTCDGCDGVAHSYTVFDACGVCGGDDSSCAGCDGVPHSGKVYDQCGTPGQCLFPTDPAFNVPCADCSGHPNGDKIVDVCHACRAPSDPLFNATCDDCAGVPKGPHKVDACGNCTVPGMPGWGMGCADCRAVPNGGYIHDLCGRCLDPADDEFDVGCIPCDGVVGSGASRDICGDCKVQNDTTRDRGCLGCDGEIFSLFQNDSCGACLAITDPAFDQDCVDCFGTPNGNVTVDECGVCGGDGTSCRLPFNDQVVVIVLVVIIILAIGVLLCVRAFIAARPTRDGAKDEEVAPLNPQATEIASPFRSVITTGDGSGTRRRGKFE